MDKLRTFLEQYRGNSHIEALMATFSSPKKVKKKSLLIRPGQNATFLAFINKGLFRVYFKNEAGIEVTTWFSFAGMMVTDMLAYFTEKPATFYVQALEESELLIIQKSQLEKVYKIDPDSNIFGRRYLENVLVKIMERMLTLQTKSANERYHELLNQPQFMQKIPLKYLASYLGITDTSLSRIRKQL